MGNRTPISVPNSIESIRSSQKKENVFPKRVKRFPFFEELAFAQFFTNWLTPRRGELFFDSLDHP
jgi:hypothetical protein